MIKPTRRSAIAARLACAAAVAVLAPAVPSSLSLLAPASARAQTFFAPDSLWNAPVPADAPVDPNSPAIVGNLLEQEATETLGIATTKYGVPIYTVPADQPTVKITIDTHNVYLQGAFDAVPLPPNAQPAAGTDANLAVYQPSTNTMWEVWKLYLATNGSGWHAKWAGRMPDVDVDPGYYRNLFTPSNNLLEQWTWGTDATSFPLVAGVMTIAELQSGAIPHALYLAISNTCAGLFAAPAQRTDGNVTGDSTCVPEGAHFRLDPNLDLASLNLPHFTLMMAQAAQTYGIVISNRSHGFSFRCEDPSQFIAEYGYNPYTGPDGKPGTPGALLDEWPSSLVRAFPWSYLQLLQMSLRTGPDTTKYFYGG